MFSFIGFGFCHATICAMTQVWQGLLQQTTQLQQSFEKKKKKVQIHLYKKNKAGRIFFYPDAVSALNQD